MKEDARLSGVSQYKGWNGPDRWDGYLEKECSCSCPLYLALHGVQFLQDVFISSRHHRTLPEPASLLPKMQTGRIPLASLSNSGGSLAGLNLIVPRLLNKMVPQEEIQAPKSPGSPRLCHIFIKKKKKKTSLQVIYPIFLSELFGYLEPSFPFSDLIFDWREKVQTHTYKCTFLKERKLHKQKVFHLQGEPHLSGLRR